MATYNGERFLQEQLDSVMRQSLLPYELVVCDDGSTDATVSTIKAFAEDAPFSVRIYQNDQNLGYGDNFLKAASLCRGDWIAFCDQDDVWLDNKLMHYDEVLRRYPHIDLLSHSATQVNEQLKPLPQRVPGHRRFRIRGPLESKPLSSHAGFSCCVRKSILEGVPTEDRPEGIYRLRGRQAHDRYIYHVANTYGYIAELPTSLALYRRHANAATGSGEDGAYNSGLVAKVKQIASGHATSFLQMADSARQHRDYYKRIAERAEQSGEESEFVERTKRAVQYYEFVASAYERRAEIHSSRHLSATGFSALMRAFRFGAYTGLPGGAGLGRSALLHDMIRVFLPKRLAT